MFNKAASQVWPMVALILWQQAKGESITTHGLVIWCCAWFTVVLIGESLSLLLKKRASSTAAVVVALSLVATTQAYAARTAMYFGATWCGACAEMKPGVQRLRQEGYSVQIRDYDEPKVAALAAALQIAAIPAVAVFDEQPDGSLTVKDVVSRKMSEAQLRLYFKRWEVPKKEIKR